MEKNKSTAITAKTAPTDLAISQQSEALEKVTARVNQLMQFPLSYIQVQEWAATIQRVAPDTKLEKVAFVIDCFMNERLEYDKNKGIQNIFNGLKRVYHDGTSYKVIERLW